MRSLEERLNDAMPACDAWTARVVDERSRRVTVRSGVVQPPSLSSDQGVMVTVQVGRGRGYAATADRSVSGLRAAGERAKQWAERAHDAGLFDMSTVPFATPEGTWSTPVEIDPWSVPLADAIELLRQAGEPLKSDAIIDVIGELWMRQATTTLLTSSGTRAEQTLTMLVPYLGAIARDHDTLFRSNGRHLGVQGGYEHVLAMDLVAEGHQIAHELGELLAAPDCPEGRRDLLLDPSQMVLQIHESIGHPLELDRILGDERNFAGTTFVTPDMVGTYAYGSEHLNITFDPTVAGELASYRWDDEGQPATREHLIRDGVLVRVLGGADSQARSGLPGVSCSRSANWRRPPIDRMANLNLEPGNKTLDQLIGSVENGIFMHTNHSWSIDERRDKFQFGCEYARLITDGELGPVVRKPNYRGRSRDFWRNLAAVGDESTFEVQGTPFCGKGEPNQIIPVGHASPVALFRDVDVFGGA